MLEAVLKAKYNIQDVGFAVQSTSPSDIFRDMTRTLNRLLPRRPVPGPGGGEFSYMHVVEAGLFVSLSRGRKHPVPRQVMHGLAQQVLGNDYALRIYNRMSAEQRSIVDNHGTVFADDDYPIIGKGEDGTEYRSSRNLNWLVDFASLFFTDEVVSRDPIDPTLLIYNPLADRTDVGTEVLLSTNCSVYHAHQKMIDMIAYGGDDKHRRYISERCDDLAVFNLTSFIVRVEERLALRLKAREIIGG